MQHDPAPPNPTLPTLHAHKLSLSQITAAKAVFTKQLKQRAMDAVLASRVSAVLTKELDELNDHPLPTVTAGPNGDDIMNWRAYLMGPENTPYFAGIFVLCLEFPSTYPRDPPKVTFNTSMYHPGVSAKDGQADPSSFGLDATTGKGTADNTVRAVLEKAVQFFTSSVYAEMKGPGIRNQKANEQCKHDPRGFYETAVRWTYAYAK